MILADTSVWVDHLRRGDDKLVTLLTRSRILIHPFVIGELILGNLNPRGKALHELQNLPRASVATDAEVVPFIVREGLSGTGIGYVDAHLLAAVRLTPDALLWTRDRRLAEVAERLSIAVDSIE